MLIKGVKGGGMFVMGIGMVSVHANASTHAGGAAACDSHVDDHCCRLVCLMPRRPVLAQHTCASQL